MKLPQVPIHPSRCRCVWRHSLFQFVTLQRFLEDFWNSRYTYTALVHRAHLRSHLSFLDIEIKRLRIVVSNLSVHSELFAPFLNCSMSTEPLSSNDHLRQYDEENPPIAVTVSPIQQQHQPTVTAIPVNDGNNAIRIIGVYTANDLSENLVCAVTLSRSMKILSIVDAVCLCILSFFSIFWLIFLVGPLCGYLGAKRFDKNYTIAYTAFWGFRLVFDFLAALFLNWFFLLNFILDIIIIKYVWSYLQALRALSPQELAVIKEAIGEDNRV